MPNADDHAHLATSIFNIPLVTPPPLLNDDDDDDDEELYLIGNNLLGLTHELLGSPAVPSSSNAMDTMQERMGVLELTPSPSPEPNEKGESPLLAKEEKIPVVLPMELVCLALDFVDPRDQLTFAAASKVCRQWYFAATSHL